MGSPLQRVVVLLMLVVYHGLNVLSSNFFYFDGQFLSVSSSVPIGSMCFVRWISFSQDTKPVR